jgi:hypothetical protein
MKPGKSHLAVGGWRQGVRLESCGKYHFLNMPGVRYCMCIILVVICTMEILIAALGKGYCK